MFWFLQDEGNQDQHPDVAEVVAEEADKSARLRSLMRQREGLVNRLVELDYSIWVLEEFFRAGSP